MASTRKRYGWAILMGVLVALAIPWFLWGDARTAFGLPLWLWWHIVWMVAASVIFWLFTHRAWGLWIVDSDGDLA